MTLELKVKIFLDNYRSDTTKQDDQSGWLLPAHVTVKMSEWCRISMEFLIVSNYGKRNKIRRRCLLGYTDCL
jgi:hypothetical protein